MYLNQGGSIEAHESQQKYFKPVLIFTSCIFQAEWEYFESVFRRLIALISQAPEEVGLN